MAWIKNPIYPLGIVLVVAAIIFAQYFIGGDAVNLAYTTINNWVIVIGVVTIWIGGINVFRRNLRDIKRKEPGRWHLAIFQLFLIAAMLISGFGEGRYSTQSGPGAPQTVINWLYSNYQIIGSQAISALTGLWAMTAVYRAFRGRTIESFLFLLGAAFVMLKNAPIGGIIWSGFPVIGTWILDAIYNPTVRALVLIMGIGIFAYALRFYIGKEKSAWGVTE